MARIGIITCSNCTQNMNCASVVCLGDMRKRKGLFERYPQDQPLDLVGIINCAGCPTILAPDKILPRVKSLVEYRIDALHLSYCMTVLCPFVGRYERVIKERWPGLDIVRGTHQPGDTEGFKTSVAEMLCPSVAVPQDMNDRIMRRFRLPD